MRGRKLDEPALILADAETMGDEAAAKKWNIGTRSIRRIREQALSDPDSELARVALEKRRALSEGWLDAAKQARMEALALGLGLAKSSDNLRDVTGFLKIVHDAVMADELLNKDDGGELPGRGDEVARPPSAPTEVQGEASTKH